MILVPTDFTPVADCAMNHALVLAKNLGDSILALHIIEKENLRKEAEEKIGKILSTATAQGIKAEGLVKTGNIFDDIGAEAAARKAKYIIMGTHGVKGMQHITGSHALKVITNSSIPFIVVQQRNISAEGYKKIICPFDLSKETKQKMALTIQVAKYFSSKIYVVSPYESDEFLKNTVKRNLAFAEHECKINQVECETMAFPEKGNFVKQTLQFAASVNADLITMINTQEPGVHEYIAGTEERQFITNAAQIPVMCIHPKDIEKYQSVLFS
jgi:nucleotide-binding universal stress UspA family protein